MQGLVGREQRDDFLPEFQTMARSFRRKQAQTAPPSEAMAAERNARREANRQRRENREPARSVRFGRTTRQNAEAAPDAKPIAVRLKKPKQKLPLFRYRDQDVQTTDAIGNEDDRAESFDDRAPEGGLLVGARVIIGDSFGESVSAIEPVFQVGDEYKSSGVRGKSEGDAHVLLAPDGHAVGGVQIRAGAVMDAIRLVYMPLKGRQLDVEKVQHSDWVGGDGGSEQEIIGDGSLVVGFGGAYRDNEMREVRLHFVEPEQVRTVAVRRQPAGTKAADGKNESRTWKSASGKFSVVATLESFDGKEAVLISQDGKKIRVAPEKLTESDQEYLREWQQRQAESESEAEPDEESPFE
jgi:hypothetical protein